MPSIDEIYVPAEDDPPEGVGAGGDGGEEQRRPTAPTAPFVIRCPLAAPLEGGVAEVVLRPLTLGETRDMTEAEDLPRFAILSTMSGLSPDTLASLSWPDAEVVMMRASRLVPEALQERLLG